MASEPAQTAPARGGAIGLARRVAREPLVHFLLIGAVLFAGLESFQALRRPQVRIDAQDLEQLATYWQVQMQRRPNKDELKHIIDDRIDEELMAREAIRLGLDKDDMIIRRRLAQKMAFATEDTQVAEPTDAELRAYYAKTADRYAAPARVSFQQVFFSGDRPNGGAEKAAGQALERAEEGGRADPSGDPFLFPLAYQDVSAQDLLRDYGTAFVKTLTNAPIGAWAGPVSTPYGWHLVKVSARAAAGQAAFDSVKPQVRDALVAERRAEANAAFLKSLRKRYRVVVAGVDN